MDMVLDGVVLCRQTKSIPAHGMYQIVSIEQLIAAPHVAYDVTTPMSYMKTAARRIREHVKAVILGFFLVLRIDRDFFPTSSPFLFNFLMIIKNRHFYSSCFLSNSL